MRLLLDEHVDPAIAIRLRSAGHDVVALVERDELVGATDASLLELGIRERRVLVTRDYSTVRPLLKERLTLEQPSFGVIFLARSLPSGRSGVVAISGALEDLLVEHPEDDALVDREVWVSASAPV